MLKLPPPFWALAYTLIAVGASYLMGWPRVTGLPLVWLGVVLVVLGIGLSVPAAMLFRREGTYLGLVIVTLGIALWVGAWPMFLAPIAIFATANWVHIPFEEAKMRRQFGAAYDDYVAQVRRWA